MGTEKPVDGAKNTTLSGTFRGKVFEGPYNAVPRCMKEMEELLAEEGKKAKRYFVHFAYCPKCVKQYGKNFMIVFVEVG